MALPTLTQADAANFEVGAGTSLTMSGLTSYTGGGARWGDLNSRGLRRRQPPLVAKSDDAGCLYLRRFLVQVGPSSGGDVELPLVTDITGPVSLTCDGGSLDIGERDGEHAHLGQQERAINVPTLPQGSPSALGPVGPRRRGRSNIAQGDSVSLISGTYVGAIFNVNQGATLDLTGGQTVTY